MERVYSGEVLKFKISPFLLEINYAIVLLLFLLLLMFFCLFVFCLFFFLFCLCFFFFFFFSSRPTVPKSEASL